MATSEQIWDSVFGPYATRTSVLAEAESQGVTPQDYTMTSVVDAVNVGADFGQGDRESDVQHAYHDLCEQLDVTTVA